MPFIDAQHPLFFVLEARDWLPNNACSRSGTGRDSRLRLGSTSTFGSISSPSESDDPSLHVACCTCAAAESQQGEEEEEYYELYAHSHSIGRRGRQAIANANTQGGKDNNLQCTVIA